MHFLESFVSEVLWKTITMLLFNETVFQDVPCCRHVAATEVDSVLCKTTVLQKILSIADLN